MFQHFKIVGCWSILRSGRKICELELTGTSLITVLLSVPYDMVTLKLWKWKIFFPTLKLKGMLNVDVVLLSVRYDMVSFSLRKCKKKFLNLNLSERWMLMYHCFVECPIWYGDNKDWENLWQVFDSFFNLRETFVVDVSLFCWVSHMIWWAAPFVFVLLLQQRTLHHIRKTNISPEKKIAKKLSFEQFNISSAVG